METRQIVAIVLVIAAGFMLCTDPIRPHFVRSGRRSRCYVLYRPNSVYFLIKARNMIRVLAVILFAATSAFAYYEKGVTNISAGEFISHEFKGKNVTIYYSSMSMNNITYDSLIIPESAFVNMQLGETFRDIPSLCQYDIVQADLTETTLKLSEHTNYFVLRAKLNRSIVSYEFSAIDNDINYQRFAIIGSAIVAAVVITLVVATVLYKRHRTSKNKIKSADQTGV